VQFDLDGPTPRLEPGEAIQCNACKTVFGSGPGTEMPEYGGGGAQCPECEEWKGFVRVNVTAREQTVGARWPGVRGGWTPMPNALYTHTVALGLTAADVGLLDALESRRRATAEPVFLSLEKLAAEMGVSYRFVRGRVNEWVAAGLVEKAYRRAPKGNLQVLLTRYGLTRAIAHIDAHVDDDGRVPGLDDLLAGLRADAKAPAAPRATTPAARRATTTGTTCHRPVAPRAREEEAVEEEAIEEDPYGRVPEARDWDSFVAKAIEMFDATENTTNDSDEGEKVTYCPYQQHRASDWRSPDGPWPCGVCHPPAVAGVVADRRSG
jgi:hypothetical protein